MEPDEIVGPKRGQTLARATTRKQEQSGQRKREREEELFIRKLTAITGNACAKESDGRDSGEPRQPAGS